MENLTVSSVYGTGLYDAARDLGAIDEFSVSLKKIREVLNENPDLMTLLQTPTVNASERKIIVQTIFKDSVSAEVLNFMYVLIDKRRIGQIVGITKAFEKICDEQRGITKGEILSAVPLSDSQIKKFEVETGTLLKKSVKLENRIDKSILGGVKIYFDGKLIDASIRNRLDELREKIL